MFYIVLSYSGRQYHGYLCTHPFWGTEKPGACFVVQLCEDGGTDHGKLMPWDTQGVSGSKGTMAHDFHQLWMLLHWEHLVKNTPWIILHLLMLFFPIPSITNTYALVWLYSRDHHPIPTPPQAKNVVFPCCFKTGKTRGDRSWYVNHGLYVGYKNHHQPLLEPS